MAVTDHGVMYGAIEFYHAAKKAGIKPIIGCEVYVAPRTRFDKVHRVDSSHLPSWCCCARMRTGYQNLIKLVSAGLYRRAFTTSPGWTMTCSEQHHEGLICLSACLAGRDSPDALPPGDYDAADQAVKRVLWTSVRQGELFSLSCRTMASRNRSAVLPQLIKLARENEVALVATNDAHYHQPGGQRRMQSILVCIQTGRTVNDPSDLEFQTDEFYIKSTGGDAPSLFRDVHEAFENTVRIAERCNVEFEFGKTKLPYFAAPDGEDNLAYFRQHVL